MKHLDAVSTDLEAARIRERFERLLAAGVAIFSRHDLDHVLQEVVDAAREVVGARYAALGVLGEDRGRPGLLIRKAKRFRPPNLTRNPRPTGFPRPHPPMTSFLGVPVKSQGG